MPSIGLGTWQAAAEPGVLSAAVTSAMKIGYRHIDSTQTFRNETERASEDIPKALAQSFKDLQLDYVDLCLIHWPARLKDRSAGYMPENLSQADMPSTWRAMEALNDSGKARAIGVSNFSVKKLGDLLELARMPPAVNQVKCHPSWQQAKLRAFCLSEGVHLSALLG